MTLKSVYRFELLRKPTALRRARGYLNNDNKISFFDSQFEEKKYDRIDLLTQMRKKGYIHKLKPPIGVHLIFHLKGRLKKDEDTIPHDKKPDLDNMIKYYLDVLNGVIFEDDRHISKIEAEKIISRENKTVIEVYTME